MMTCLVERVSEDCLRIPGFLYKYEYIVRSLTLDNPYRAFSTLEFESGQIVEVTKVQGPAKGSSHWRVVSIVFKKFDVDHDLVAIAKVMGG